MKKAGEERDFAFRAELEAGREEHAAKLKKLEEDARLLAEPVSKSGGFGRGGVLAGHALLLYGATEAAINDE
ncbi:hypothetical protein GLAREA_11446 [Glarea lozoyensis ATCC 20868]|uniref:Uncharacterized protein n=1 Tax=Glarea lozoyensis (strain ATCC 20868 / MF5171) TaxID=1116229 RepID=S3CG41_GLAL2|nr:uncharacterized protein GLAREA_11446 [Glarea lozoyensis ATCC 20868]EPE24865.1 hypothetical protein GLAREA_11446 [Glarea lozoyensis ATCC 20868]